MGFLSDALRASRQVFQQTQVQPNKGSLPQPMYKARNILQWDRSAPLIHATRAITSVAAYGSTKPNEFITIQGQAPQAPTIISVPTVAGSNAPGGLIQ